ncbi:unnamed protein product [Leuciscus chuanchicus]
MKTAFALRRKEVITDNLTFRACSERKILAQGKWSEVLSQLFRIYEIEEKVDIRVQRAAILRSLPARLQEDDSNFLKTWDVEHSDEPDNDVPLGLLSICGILTDATLFCPEKIVVVLEGACWVSIQNEGLKQKKRARNSTTFHQNYFDSCQI